MSRSSSSSSITLIDHSEDFHTLTTIPKCPTTQSVELNSSSHGIDLSLETITTPLSNLLHSQMQNLSRPLKIVGLLATQDKGCQMYARMTARHCLSNGVVYERVDVHPARTTQQSFEGDTGERDDQFVQFEQVKSAIERINGDENVDGLIVYFPLFGSELDAELRQMISPRIDVEGLTRERLSKVYNAPPPDPISQKLVPGNRVFPCTALAVLRCIQSIEIWNPISTPNRALEGRVVTIVNRSETVGRPLAAMLANAGAVVYSVDVNSSEVLVPKLGRIPSFEIAPCTGPLSALTSISDIVISAVPNSSFKIPTGSLKARSVCINVATGNNFHDDVKNRASVFVEKVGEITRWVLLLNALLLRFESEGHRY